MATEKSFVDNTQLEEKIQMILRQTDYNEEQVREKMIEFNGDHIAIIKSFLGISEKKEQPIKTINQEIYRQIRFKLDSSMREYNQRKQSDKSV
jgi:hypothetical protein